MVSCIIATYTISLISSPIYKHFMHLSFSKKKKKTFHAFMKNISATYNEMNI